MRRYGYLFTLLAVGVALIVTVAYWTPARNFLKPELISASASEKDNFMRAQLLIEEGRAAEALKIIRKYRSEIERNSTTGSQWLDLFIRASVETLDGPQLMLLYQYRPDAFTENEKAALMIADALLTTGRGTEYEELRERWEGNEGFPNKWLILDVDKQLFEGNRTQAIHLLKSHEFEGARDSDRLVRLALLHLHEDPKMTWDYLSQALKKDPNNSNVRSYRGKLLEMVNQPRLALSEYIAVSQLEPDNVYLRDQLAEFYLRQKQYQQALEIWSDNLNGATDDLIWLKAYFWSHITQPIDFNWSEALPPEGKLRPLLIYLIHLSPSEFWNNSKFAKVANGLQYLNSEQATWWLRLLEAVRKGNKKEAWELLESNPFSERSWSPTLTLAIKQVLAYQTHQTLDLISSGMPETLQEKQAAQEVAARSNIFTELNTWAEKMAHDPSTPLPNELEALIESPFIYPALLIAAGWHEAALKMQATQEIPANLPAWVAYEYAEAIRRNRSNSAALEFANLQKMTPHLRLLIGEIMIAEGNSAAAFDQIESLSRELTPLGMRAAWLISLVYIEQGDYSKAKAMINNNSELANAILGREALARIALLEGDDDLADHLYESLVHDSAEAQSFLARKAFAESNWKRARELTIELLKIYPNNAMLRTNLSKIDKADPHHQP